MNRIFRYLIKNISIILSTITFKLFLVADGFYLPKKMIIDGIIDYKIRKKGKLKIGNNFTLLSRRRSNFVGINNRATFEIYEKGSIEIGDFCGFTSTVLSCRSKIKIGNYVKIGANVRIFDHDYHSLNYKNRRDSKTDSSNIATSPIIIDDDVFIGTNSIILKGVHIGARCIIGAGSVVSLKNIPPDSILAGNPARIIKNANYYLVED